MMEKWHENGQAICRVTLACVDSIENLEWTDAIGGCPALKTIHRLSLDRTRIRGYQRYNSGGHPEPSHCPYLSELRRFAKNLNSPLTNSWTNRTTVDPSRVTLQSNKEGGEQSFAKHLKTYNRDLYTSRNIFTHSLNFNTRSSNHHHLYLFRVKLYRLSR